MTNAVADTSSSSDLLVEQVEKLLPRLYLPAEESPYHNADHAYEVLDNVQQVLESCRAAGLQADEPALIVAALLHDALQHVPAHLLGFSSSEKLAGVIAYEFLRGAGYSEATARCAESAILATNPFIYPQSLEQKVLRAADLLNLRSPYDRFKASSERLFREAQLRGTERIDRRSFLFHSYRILQNYLWPLLTVTPDAFDKKGRSVFHLFTIGNILRYSSEALGGERLPMHVHLLPSTMRDVRLPPINGPLIRLIIHPDEAIRKELISNLGPRQQEEEILFVVPGTGATLPLPEGCCDRLVLHESGADDRMLSELEHIVHRSGTVVVQG